MSEQEKYWGCTPVVTAHMEAMLKTSREYAKMVSNDDETPAQRADRAKDFQCGAIWEKGYSKKHGWHPASELPVIPEGKFSVTVIAYCNTPSGIYAPVEVAYTRTGGWQYESVEWWCYPPKED